MNSIFNLTAAQLGQHIQSGKLDPVALTQAYLDAAEDHPQSHRIFTMLTPDRAMAEARAAQTRASTAPCARNPVWTARCRSTSTAAHVFAATPTASVITIRSTRHPRISAQTPTLVARVTWT